MVHLLATGFFAGLLVVLAVILEQVVKAHWTEIAAALKGESVRPARPEGRRPAAGKRAVA